MIALIIGIPAVLIGLLAALGGDVLGGLIILAIGLALDGWAIGALRWRDAHEKVRRALGGIDVQLLPRMVSRGRSVTCTMRFQPEQAIELEKVTATLVAEEVVQRSTTDSDGDTVTETFRQRVFEETIAVAAGRPLTAGEAATLDATLTPAIDAPPTFSSAHNDLRWFVAVQISLPGHKPWTAMPILTVRP